MKVSRILMMILSVALVLTSGFLAFLPSAQAQQSSATIEFADPLYYRVVFVYNWPDGGGSFHLMDQEIPRGQSIANTAGASMHTPMVPPAGNLVLGSWNTQPDGTGAEFTINTPIYSHMIVYAQWILAPPPPEPPPPFVPPAPEPPVVPPAPEPLADIEILPADMPLTPELPEEMEILPADVPLVPEPPETPDEDEIDLLPDAELTEIEDEQMPMATMPDSGNWAMSNLILSILGILIVPAVLIAGKRRGEYAQNRTQKNVCLAVICAVAVTGAVMFFLTQDMSAAVIAADSWTVLHAAMLAVQGITATLLFIRKNGNAPKAA